MHTNHHSNSNTTDNDPTDRPLSFWLKATGRLLAVERETLFAREGVTRRDWRILNRLSKGVPTHPRAGGSPMRTLVDRGWIERREGEWALTTEGEALNTRLTAAVDGLSSTMSEALSPEELETTLASLRKISVALGWDENAPLPRRQHRGPRRGPHARGEWTRGEWNRGERTRGHDDHFGHRYQQRPPVFDGQRHDPHPGCQPHESDQFLDGRDGHPRRPGRQGHPGHPGHRRFRMAQRVFERGFDAGFARGRGAE